MHITIGRNSRYFGRNKPGQRKRSHNTRYLQCCWKFNLSINRLWFLHPCGTRNRRVASTKAFTAQVTVLTLLALMIGKKKGTIPSNRFNRILFELNSIPEKVEDALKSDEQIKFISLRCTKMLQTHCIWVEE